MTPNPEAPIFKQNYIPENACENAKLLDLTFSKIKEDAKLGKLQGISEDDIALEYNNYDGCTKIEATFVDSNNHTHHFIIQLLPDNGFGDGTDYLYIKYLFEGEFDENVLSVRSFAEYILPYLEWEGLEPKLTQCDRGIELPGYIDHIYEQFCTLVNTALSKLKPIEWFYSKEPLIENYNGMHSYLLEVLQMLKTTADKGCLDGIKADCFNIMSDESETSICLEYQVDDVWKWLITLNGLWCESYADLSLGFSCEPYNKLSKGLQKKLDNLFAEFLDNLPSSKGNIYIGGGRGEHSLSIQYFHIEDSIALFCNLIDEITTQLKCFNFHLSSEYVNLTEEMETIKMQLEEYLHTTLSFVTEVDEINKKLSNGYFKKKSTINSSFICADKNNRVIIPLGVLHALLQYRQNQQK